MPTLYSPGATPVAVTPHGVVVLEAGTAPALACRVRDLVADGRGLGGVIEALTGAYGASLSAIPAFAVALAEGSSVRVAVRGPLVLEVQADRPERISGEGVTTWTERVIDAVSRVALSSLDAARPGAPAEAAELVIVDGVVLAGRVEWEPASGSAARGDAEGAPRAATTPASAAPAAPAAPAATAESHAPATAPQTAPAASPSGPGATPDAADAPAAASTAPDETIATGRPRRPRTAPPTGLIDSSAVLSVAADTLLPNDSTFIPRAEPKAAPPATAVSSATPGPDPLAATVVRPTPPAGPNPVQGDHDGETISLAQARAMRTGDPLTSSMPPLAPPRPRAPGRIRVSTGQMVALDRTVVIGRRPRSTRVSGTDLPHLIAVESPQQDISRSHVELRVEGDSIVATDLRTTNGTTLRRAGSDPVRLHPGEGTVVVPGDILDLGDGITVAIEELV